MVPATTYSLRWAWGVFLAWQKSFPRATTFWEEITDFDDLDIVSWIASDQRRWVQFKKQVKWLKMRYGCKMDLDDPGTIQMLRSLTMKHRSDWREWPREGLTASRARAILGEQGS